MATTAEQRTALKDNPQALAAYEAALAETKLETATTLAKYKSGFATVLGLKSEEEKKQLTPEAIANIAHDFVETGSFKFNEKTYTRDSLIKDAKVLNNDAQEFAKALPEIAGLFGAMPDPDTLIPKQEDMSRPATRISEAVAENNGWLSQIWIAIQGFFNWLVDLFNGGESQGLMEHIHMVGARTVAHAAHDKIAADMEQDPAFATTIGGAEGLRKITNQVYDSTMSVLSDSAPPASLSTADIANKIKDIPEVAQIAPDQLTRTQIAAAAVSTKINISSMVQEKVNDVFDTRTHGKLWGDLAQKSKQDAVQSSSWTSWSVFKPAAYANAQNTSAAVKNAIGGGKPDQASKLIGDAVAEGVMQTFKEMKPDEIKTALTDPTEKSKELAGKIAEKTFATEDWKKIEANIGTAYKDDPKTKDSILTMMKKSVTDNIGIMITEKSEAIKQAAPYAKELIVIQSKAKELNAVNLDTDQSRSLSYDELKFLDKTPDGIISASELTALPDDVRKQFAEIMAKSADTAVKTKGGGLDFRIPSNTPTTTEKPSLKL